MSDLRQLLTLILRLPNLLVAEVLDQLLLVVVRASAAAAPVAEVAEVEGDGGVRLAMLRLA